MSFDLLLEASSKMKAFLILWALGLSACNKLDRTYLPPPGSKASGGYSEILHLPLEFPKEKSSVESGVDRITEVSSTRPNYSNVAGPQVTFSETYATGTGIPFSENIYNVLNTTPSRTLTQTTTVAPTENYETTVGSMNNEDYNSKTLSFDPNLNGPEILTQQNFEVDDGHGLNKDFHYSHNSYQLSNRSELNGSPPYSDYNDENDLATYNIQQSPKIYMDILKYSTSTPIKNSDTKDTDFYDSDETAAFAELVPNQYPISTTVSTPIEFKSSEYSSTPTTSLRDNFRIYDSTANRPERVRAESDRNAIILNYKNLLTSDDFAYSYDTSNGIHADESGTATNGVRAQGSYSYTGDDGKVYSLTYTADENGFIPRGDHLPTAPPIPNAILKVIEQAAKNKQSGVTDDGSYDDSKYGHGRYQGFIGRKPQNHKYTLGGRPTNSEHTSYRNYTPIIDGHNYLHDADTGNKITISTERPYDNVGNVNKKNYYTNDERKQFVPSNKYEDDNSIYRTKEILVYKQLTDTPVNKPPVSSKTIYETSVPQRSQYVSNNQNKALTSTSLNEKYNINQPAHDGYEYNTPQSIFHPYEVSTLQPFLQNSNRESTEIPSDLFNGDYQDIPDNKQLMTQNLNYSGPGMINLSKTYNKNNFKDLAFPKNPYNEGKSAEQTADNIFSTPKPVYGSTSPGTSYYKYKIISNNGQEQKYPSSPSEPQYSSTTPLTSEFFSPSSSTINIAGYYSTTPSSDQFITTLRPQTSASILRNSADSFVSKYGKGPIVASTATPGNINRIHGRFGNRDKPTVTVNNNYNKKFLQQIPQTNNDMQVRLNVSDLRSKNIGSHSTTERVIGEVFNGPEQTQKYDPEHGCYY